VLNLDKKYERIIKLYCIKNIISIKEFFKQLIDEKLKGMLNHEE
jgi:hypothetical protein